MLKGFRQRLIVQAAVTALFGFTGSVTGWTVPTLAVAAGAVFVALAMRPEPSWRWYVVGFVGFSIAFGLVGLVSGHYVPGTLVAGYTLYALLDGSGASAFAGAPSWAPPVPVPAQAALLPPPPLVPVAPALQMAPPPVPAAPVAPVFEAAPTLVFQAPPPPERLAPRPAALTILPGK